MKNKNILLVVLIGVCISYLFNIIFWIYWFGYNSAIMNILYFVQDSFLHGSLILFFSKLYSDKSNNTIEKITKKTEAQIIKNEVVSFRDWFLTIFLTFIPIVNLVMYFLWAFGGFDKKESRVNWAKATLAWILISSIIIIIVLFIILSVPYRYY
tara:strand:- start:406 stop:867 length:462 start_codon:yes stop_codon:yes gene_type:complete